MKLKIRLKIAFKYFFTIFLFLNIISFFHAYKFTHFSTIALTKTKNPDQLSLLSKLKTVFLGVDNPRPLNTKVPTQNYETIILQSNKKIECWSIKTKKAKGTVILFHGYSADKSTMLDKSDEFIKLGYNTLIVDFMGSGGSEGNQTTIGFKEADEVKSAFNYIRRNGETNIILFGTSMGAVAILKSISDNNIRPNSIIVECPFGSMYTTTCARFKIMHLPTFPMAALLVFWGGVQNGYFAFDHNPTNYAKKVNCPTLLLYGEQDKNVSSGEINTIFENLNGPKILAIYPNAGHENYLIKYKNKWVNDVNVFLLNNKK